MRLWKQSQDRLMHRAHLLEFEGQSYRFKEAAGRMAQGGAGAVTA